MKKIILIAIFAFSVTFTSNAQKLGFGVEAGGNLSNIYTEIPTAKSTSDFKLGYQAGFFANYSITENLFIKAHLLFFTKGSYNKDESTLLGVTTSSTWETSPMYINLPVVVGFGFDLGGIKPYVNAGVYLAYGVGGKQTLETKVGNIENTYSTDFFISNTDNNMKEYFDSHDAFDFGARLGAGIVFSDKYIIELNYDLGLIDIAPKDNLLKNNNSLSLTLGYKF